MEPGSEHIVVWVGQEEKLIYGLTRDTSSADVVQALLEEQQQTIKGKSQLGNPKEYYITEKWRGFQCTLPPNTKMLKLWKSWGAEKVNVNFFLVKSELLQPCGIWNNAEYHKHTIYPHRSTASVIKSFPLNKQKSIVRKTFRKLSKMKKGMDLDQETKSINKLVQVIASQDLTIKKQINRMQELDEQFEEYKTYLQLDKEAIDEHSAHYSHLKDDMLKQQSCMSLLETENLKYNIDDTKSPYLHTEIFSNEIKQILPIPICQCEDSSAGEQNLKESWEMCMLQNLRQTVDETLQVGVKLHLLLSYIQEEINYHDSVLLRQKREHDLLKQELKLLNKSNSLETYNFQHPYSISSSEELRNITAAMSIMGIQNDTDSDTGISSIYSQSSDLVH
ncbi:ras association domain-containing protein 9 [Pyxicephalus adspersus]|uniref:Ras-associating domain-containing protein n=1 Tax=Pyxicephalus adspersus TaxID=30357 RepID=A0AAV3AHY9_PYXAD|nr:TPA: hypothetical protein GDO54_006949 [Pyxicephalus adspersus]